MGATEGREYRQLLDDVAAAREEAAIQAASAREAREVIAANEARYLAVLGSLTSDRQAAMARAEEAEARAEAAVAGLAALEQRVADAEGRAAALDAELAAVAGTRVMRWTKGPRDVYRELVRRRPGGADASE
jgi:chromosome segregation ATPase